MKLKLISDGSMRPEGTKIVNAETGELIEGISKVEWNIKAGELAEVVIFVINPEVEIFVEHPYLVVVDNEN